MTSSKGSKFHGDSYDALPQTWSVGGKKLFVFDPKKGAWAAYNAKGKQVGGGRASGGGDYCEDIKRSCRTVVGTFRVYKKGDGDCESGLYPVSTYPGAEPGGAPMPYCMYFSGGYTIHGADDIPFHNASHGCIRVTWQAAEWLSKSFIDIGTKVLVLPYSN